MFIYQICGRIMKENPDAPVFTIHDSLMTTLQHKDYIYDVMMSEFESLGVRPTIRKKPS